MWWWVRESELTENVASAKDTDDDADDEDAGAEDAEGGGVVAGGVVAGGAGVAVDADVGESAAVAEVALDVDVDQRALGVDGIPEGAARRWGRNTQQGSTESCLEKQSSLVSRQ